MAKHITDDDLVKIIDDHLAKAINHSTKTSAARAKALKYYNGEPFGNEKKGRSTYVSREVADSIGWALPQLVKILAADDVVSFDPESSDSIESAEKAAQYAHYILHKKNPGFEILHNLCHDALLQRNGYVKVSLDQSPVYSRESYEGLTLIELTQLLQDNDVEIVDHEEVKPEQPEISEELQAQASGIIDAMRSGQNIDPQSLSPEVMQAIQLRLNPPQSTHNVTIKRRKNKQGSIIVENVPPEEIIVSKEAKSLNLDLAPFVAHRVRKTISWLRSQGYKVDDDIADDNSDTSDYSDEKIVRDALDGNYTGNSDNDDHIDPSQRLVWLIEAHFLVDYDGSGIAQRRCVKKVGSKILENVEELVQPFISTSPYPQPHQHAGKSMADSVIDLQLLKSMMIRLSLDSYAFGISPARTVNVDSIVDINDLLDTSPGSFIRTRGDAAAAVNVLPQTSIGSEGLAFFDYIDQTVEGRAGVSKMTMGIDNNAFNKTASGTAQIMGASQEKTALIVRILATTGLGEIYKKIVKLAAEYIKDPAEIRLNSSFVKVNPNDWANLDTISVNVGTGALDKAQDLNNSNQLLQLQQTVGSVPDPRISSMVDPEKVHNALTRVVKGMGHKDAETFFNDPKGQAYSQLIQQASQQQPPQDPNLMLAKAQMALSEVKGAELQANTQKTQQEMFLKQQELDLKKAVETEKADLAKKKLQLESEVETAKINDTAFGKLLGDIERHTESLTSGFVPPPNMDGQTSMLDKLLAPQNALHQQNLDAIAERNNAQHQAIAALSEQLANLHNHLSKPKRIIRDESGKIIGAETVDDQL